MSRIAGLCVIGMLALCQSTALATETVLSFSGTDSYVDVGMPSVLQLANNNPLTVEAWVYLNSVSSRDMIYSKNSGRNTSGYTHMFGFYNSGRIAAFTGANWREPNPTVTVTTERWMHVAYSFDGTTMTYYIDGESVGTSVFNYNNVEANTVKLGGYDKNSDINGMKSEVRVWDHARTGQEISDAMYDRLSGKESGLLGYWPLNEGAGSDVLDYSGNNSTGTVVNATWVIPGVLPLNPPSSGFLAAVPFTLTNIETGSERFTNSNEVDIVTFPLPAGYDRYQINQNSDVSGIDTNAWMLTDSLPTQLSFTTPVNDTNIVFYAWFTNSTTHVTVRRSESEIFYTSVLPVPVVRATLTRERLPGSNVIVYASDLDFGSNGGVTNDIVLDVIDRVALAADLGDDMTPNEPYVTLDAEGDYPLLLWLKNEAGNAITSIETCMVSVVSYSGSNVWTGEGFTDDWHDPANWGAGVPTDGQDVTVGSGSLTLTAATAALNSFNLAQGVSLSVEGWDSAIQADDIVISGTITHAAQTVTEVDPITGEWEPQHRVLIKGSNLIVTATGRIDVDEKGYGPLQGPGGGLYTSSGAGYGGNGGAGFRGRKGAPCYGSPEDPWQPGSGGQHGAGGGAMLIEMTGAVVINGTATACGADRANNTHQTGGSGGGILILCETFHGAATGLIRVDGGRGNYYGANSGGGRIALRYDPVAQAGMTGSRPAVRFSAYAYQGLWGDSQAQRTMLAQMGTLYLPDTSLLTANPEGDVVLSDQRFWYTRLYIASHPESWSPASLTMTNCVIGFRGGCAYDTGVYEGFELNVAQDLTLVTDPGLPNTMTGDLESALYLYASRTNVLYGARLRVGGNLTVGPDSALYPWTSGYSGAIVGIRVQNNVTIAANARIDAKEQGFMPHPDNLNGPGAGKNSVAGGSYGGVGQGDAGSAYGMAALPLELGSPGGYNQSHGIPWTPTGKGGGAIHVIAGGTITVDGLLDADGGEGGYYESAAGSGGSIFLAAMNVFGGGTLRARGRPYYHVSWLNGRSGGGRIAVWHHLPLPEVERRIAERDVKGLVHGTSHLPFTGELDVSAYDANATDGTKGFYTVAGTVVLIR